MEKPTGLAVRWEIGDERKVKGDSKVLGLGNWKDGVGIC